MPTTTDFLWLIALILLLTLVVLIILEWCMRKWWNNGPATLDHEVVWRSLATYYNPSLIPEEKGAGFLVACRRSPFAHRDIFDLVANFAYVRLRQSVPDEMHVFHLNSVTGQDQQWRKLASPWLACMKYALYEDPRIHRLSDGTYCVLATFIHKQDRGVKPQAILHFDSNWNMIHAVPFDHRHQPQPCRHKNWTLFVDGEDELCLLTDVSPMIRIQHIDLKTGAYSVKSERRSPLPYKTIRCTCSPVRWDEQTLITAAHTLFFTGFHSIYQTVFVWFSDRPPYSILRWTTPLTCIPNSYVEFPSGLAYERETDCFLLGLGLNDLYALIIRLKRETLLSHQVVQEDISSSLSTEI